MNSTFSLPRSWMNWRAASRKGMDSMSPTVPPDFHEGHVHAGLLAHAEDAGLDLVGDVRDDLHGPAEEPALPLLGDDGLVDLAGGDRVVPPDGRRGEAAVVAEVEVRLRAVVGDVDLAVLVGVHRPRIHVDVGVDLDHADAEAPVFQEAADGRGGNAFSKPRADAARDENVFAHGDWIIATIPDLLNGCAHWSWYTAGYEQSDGPTREEVSPPSSHRWHRGDRHRRCLSRIPRPG